jgi:hypothetical protein
VLYYLPEDVAAAVVDGLGHEAHQATAAAAVDEIELPLRLQRRGRDGESQTVEIDRVLELEACSGSACGYWRSLY